MGRAYAGILGPLAFATILARSLIEGGNVEATLKVATLCLFLFAAIGFIVGQIAEMVVLESVKTRFEQLRQRKQPTESAEAAH